MGGRGTVRAFVNGKPTGEIHVDAEKLYTVRTGKPTESLLELRFSPGVQAYSFTFG
jgi:molybdopterin-binding protein